MKCVPDLVYKPAHDLSLDLYVPDSLKADACVIYVHGGGFQDGSRSGQEALHFAQKLTDQGLAMASISYRLKGQLEDVTGADAKSVVSSQERSRKVGITLSDELFGPSFYTAVEDVSAAIGYMKAEALGLGMGTDKVGLLGVSAGGIAALSCVFVPRQMDAVVTVPDAVVTIASALVQPWRMRADCAPCLLINGPDDPVIGIENARFGLARAEAMGAPVRLIDTGVQGHETQVDVVLDQHDSDGTPYFDHVVAQFARLRA